MKAAQALRPYRLRLCLLAPLLIGYTLWRGLRERDWRYIRERLGLGHGTNLDSPLWVHCASVGEVNAALPLIFRLLNDKTASSILITSNTCTSARLVARRADAQLQHAFLPLDFSHAVRRFIATVQPQALLIMETELWPHLYHAAASSGIQPIIVNARLSARTLNAKPWLRQAYRYCLSQTRSILAKSAADAGEFIALGAEQSKVHTLGNIKFAAIASTGDVERLVERPYVLLASTHANEEVDIATRWLAQAQSDHLLVIAPRHSERGDEIYRQLKKLSEHLARRSLGEPVKADTRIYLADTLGELDALYAHADWVVMGGTFTPVGGHNILEPARHGATILCGPHMHNFSDELSAMLSAEAIVSLPDIERLMPTLHAFQTGEISATGANAKAWIEQQANVLDHYVDAIKRELV